MRSVIASLRNTPFALCLTLCAFAQSDAPESLKPPAGQSLLFQAHGVGDQVYSCKSAGWVLKAPDAQLFSADQQVVGRHFAGPTWEWKDKSAIVGKMAASVPAPDGSSIPWLLVTVIQSVGDGAMSPVVSVQRLHTKGGKAPAEGCNAAHVDSEQRVHYEADYLFYGK
jgi:hypothetical protein